MPDWADDVLAGLDEPRPLPPALRERLEDSLLAEAAAPRPLDHDLSGRLQESLTDPVPGLLDGIDGPRPLSPTARRTLERAFRADRSRRRAVAGLSAAAALVVLGGAVAYGLGHTTNATPRPTADRATHHSSPPHQSAASGAAASNGTAGAVAAPVEGAVPAAGLNPTAATTAPSIASVSPASGSTKGGTVVTITGTGLDTVATVLVGGQRANFTILSASEITVTMPAHAPGAVDIEVTAPGGRSAVDARAFTYVAG